jgi:hypothetical protein
MGTDRARKTFDPSRMYRSVVAQQGRVTLEADANEAEEIRTSDSRAELLDVVGRTGSPDNGFSISVPPTDRRDFSIGRGTIYVGGVRVQLLHDQTYLTQHENEWADSPPLESSLPADSTRVVELVYLAVSEQEVGAVEDPALREVALGGPDTTARTRLLQRVHRAPMSGIDGEASLASIVHKTTPGLVLDPKTMRLESQARLRVDFVLPSDEPSDDPCEPVEQAGFLGPENQLIRVQVTEQGKLLWGYDNASSLYRADVATDNSVTLQGTPVDIYHWPKPRQWAEVLGTAVNLGDGSYVASEVGLNAEIAEYDSSLKRLVLQLDVPAQERLATLRAQQVFVRVWEGQHGSVGDPATATPPELIDASGSSTGLRIWTSGRAAPGDYWLIGVRPGKPHAIFPERLREFQAPDGPSRWATPLARLAWHSDFKTARVLDYRRPFDSLVELTHDRCELRLEPDDDLQTAIDERVYRNAMYGISHLHVLFSAGTYSLAAPLQLDGMGRARVTVSGCGATLISERHPVALLVTNCESAKVFDLSVEARVAQPAAANGTIWPGSEFGHLGGAITLVNCKSAVVERVAAGCASSDRQTVSCVAVRNPDNEPGDARVRSCQFAVGTRQTGVLLVNVNRATVEDNQIGWHSKTEASLPEEIVKRTLMSDVMAAANGHTSAIPREARTLRIANEPMFVYTTDAQLAPAAWDVAFLEAREKTLSPSDVEGRFRIQRVVSSVIDQALGKRPVRAATATAIEPFRAWFARAAAREKRVAAAGRGIVVGGGHARDIRVLNNTMQGVMDGVHIALSSRGQVKRHAFADRVQVVGNTIQVRVPWYERNGHAGIFLGNVNIGTVRDNQIDVQLLTEPWPDRPFSPLLAEPPVDFPATQPADGIRVWGLPGELLKPAPAEDGSMHRCMLLIAGNVVNDASIAVHIQYVEDVSTFRSICRVSDNLSIRAHTTAWRARFRLPLAQPIYGAIQDSNVPAPLT